MPFNQAFSFPHELTLRTTEDGIRMFSEPVKDIEKLYKKRHLARHKRLAEGRPISVRVSGDVFDITATFEPGEAACWTIRRDTCAVAVEMGEVGVFGRQAVGL